MFAMARCRLPRFCEMVTALTSTAPCAFSTGSKRVEDIVDLLELRAVADGAANDDRVVEADDLDARRRDRAAQHLRDVVELLRGHRHFIGHAPAAGPDEDGRVARRLAVHDHLRRADGHDAGDPAVADGYAGQSLGLQ